MTVSNKKKLLEFIENSENRQLVIWFFTLITYVILMLFLKNMIVLLFGYFLCYLIYSRLYNYMLIKIKNSFKEKTNVEVL